MRFAIEEVEEMRGMRGGSGLRRPEELEMRGEWLGRQWFLRLRILGEEIVMEGAVEVVIEVDTIVNDLDEVGVGVELVDEEGLEAVIV